MTGNLQPKSTSSTSLKCPLEFTEHLKHIIDTTCYLCPLFQIIHPIQKVANGKMRTNFVLGVLFLSRRLAADHRASYYRIYSSFSNSFMIHQVLKTQKITTVKEFWIPGLKISIDFGALTSRFSLLFQFALRRYIKHSGQCFIS